MTDQQPAAWQMREKNLDGSWGDWLDPMPIRDRDASFQRRYGRALESGKMEIRPLYPDAA
jgi:hypothetical protein